MPAGFSDPLTIFLKPYESEKENYTSEQLIALITHEIAHNLQRGLFTLQYKRKMKEMYPEMIVRNHVLTYALLQVVLPFTIFRLEEEKAQKKVLYKKSLEIMKEKGAKKIIAQAKRENLNAC
jgi:uncharacterized protein YjaZ